MYCQIRTSFFPTCVISNWFDEKSQIKLTLSHFFQTMLMLKDWHSVFYCTMTLYGFFFISLILIIGIISGEKAPIQVSMKFILFEYHPFSHIFCLFQNIIFVLFGFVSYLVLAIEFTRSFLVSPNIKIHGPISVICLAILTDLTYLIDLISLCYKYYKKRSNQVSGGLKSRTRLGWNYSIHKNSNIFVV